MMSGKSLSPLGAGRRLGLPRTFSELRREPAEAVHVGEAGATNAPIVLDLEAADAQRLHLPGTPAGASSRGGRVPADARARREDAHA